jgi:hypothetical protein
MNRTSRRKLLFSAPAALAVSAQSQPASEEIQRVKAANDSNQQALRQVKLKQDTEPAFSFRA